MQVHIHDSTEFDPEVLAMLQAFYSRSDLGIEERIKMLLEDGEGETAQDKIRNAMKKYYVGYGHKSIGDLGDTAIFLEDISMLAAKAVQDHPLYNGQECSTRYMDFRHRAMILPGNDPEGTQIANYFMHLYEDLMPKVVEGIKSEHPLQDGEKFKDWEQAAVARAFDVLRCLIPAGMTTRISWSTNLRQAADGLLKLGSHPLEEVRGIARATLENLLDRYPNSFKHDHIAVNNCTTDKDRPRIEARNEYLNNHQHQPKINLEWTHAQGKVVYGINQVDIDGINEHRLALADRPSHVELPNWFGAYGQYQVGYKLDFGSYRDVQRHRNLVNLPPMITQFEFHPWYVEQIKRFADYNLGEDLAKAAVFFDNSTLDRDKLQYYYPMGTLVDVRASLTLPEMMYITELRAGKSVHPTLREIAQSFAGIIHTQHPYAAVHADMDPSWWDVRRGTQTIEKKDGRVNV